MYGQWLQNKLYAGVDWDDKMDIYVKIILLLLLRISPDLRLLMQSGGQNISRGTQIPLLPEHQRLQIGYQRTLGSGTHTL